MDATMHCDLIFVVRVYER